MSATSAIATIESDTARRRGRRRGEATRTVRVERRGRPAGVSSIHGRQQGLVRSCDVARPQDCPPRVRSPSDTARRARRSGVWAVHASPAASSSALARSLTHPQLLSPKQTSPLFLLIGDFAHLSLTLRCCSSPPSHSEQLTHISSRRTHTPAMSSALASSVTLQVEWEGKPATFDLQPAHASLPALFANLHQVYSGLPKGSDSNKRREQGDRGG